MQVRVSGFNSKKDTEEIEKIKKIEDIKVDAIQKAIQHVFSFFLLSTGRERLSSSLNPKLVYDLSSF